MEGALFLNRLYGIKFGFVWQSRGAVVHFSPWLILTYAVTCIRVPAGNSRQAKV